MAAWGVLLLGFLWTYWETLVHMVRVWYTTPDYGHGFFVPIFAGFLLWQRQEMVDPWPNRGTWWGMPFFVVFALVRWFNLFLNYERDIDSLLPFSGWHDARSGRMAGPAVGVAFDRLLDFHGAASGLRGRGVGREVATRRHHHERLRPANPWHPGHRAGRGSNVIQLSQPENKLEVARACSGLRMMTVFFAICVGASFLLRMPVWKKIILIVSAVPIAIISNVLRIVLTGMLYEWVSKPTWGISFTTTRAGG